MRFLEGFGGVFAGHDFQYFLATGMRMLERSEVVDFVGDDEPEIVGGVVGGYCGAGVGLRHFDFVGFEYWLA